MIDRSTATDAASSTASATIQPPSKPISADGGGSNRRLAGRLWIDQPRDGVTNMAIDQALLESLVDEPVLTLRLYRWARPTVSLGYFQRHAELAEREELRGVDRVRRGSGGGAIVHDREWTYTLAVPRAAYPCDPDCFYTDVHDAFADALKDAGVNARRHQRSPAPASGSAATEGHPESNAKHDEPFHCFARRTADDLVFRGYKILGSAQRRSVGGLIQHGSLLCRASPFAPALPGIEDLCGTVLGEPFFNRNLPGRLGVALGVNWSPGKPAAELFTAAEQISRTRYGNPRWLERR